jgi:hypothetical protein
MLANLPFCALSALSKGRFSRACSRCWINGKHAQLELPVNHVEGLLAVNHIGMLHAPPAGCLQYANGDMYEGGWSHDQRHGQGSFTSHNGNIFVGTFVQGKRQGLGTLYCISQGELRCAGRMMAGTSCRCSRFFTAAGADHT